MNTTTDRPDMDDPLFNDEESEEEISYGELYSSALLNNEIVITISAEDEEKTIAGIKNFKNKRNIRFKKDGMPIDSSIVSFHAEPSKEFDGHIDLSIIVTKRGAVKVKALRIPESDLPE